MGYEGQDFDGIATEVERGPSWARPGWPPASTDDLTAALDPTQMQVAVKAAAKAGGKTLTEAELAQAAGDSIRAMMLIRAYRVRGHLAANLDPLGLTQRELPADLTPEYHGFSGEAQMALRNAYKLIVREGLPLAEALAKIEAELPPLPEVRHLVQFIRNSGRGIIK